MAPARHQRSLSPSHKKHRKKHHHRSRSRSAERSKPKTEEHRTTKKGKLDKYGRSSSDNDSDTDEHQENRHHRQKIRRKVDRHGRSSSDDSETEERNSHHHHNRARDNDKHHRSSDDRHRKSRQEHEDRRRDDHRRKRDELGHRRDRNNPGEFSGQDQNSKPQTNEAKPDFALSGKLTEDTNTYKGVVIKYNQPPEARKPRKRWRLYPFKGEEGLPVLHIHRESAFLIGRERRVVDIPTDHPSCSKQHAVLQFRLVEFRRNDGNIGRRVRPYIIDLGSTNGTYVNNKRIDSERYVELIEKDVLKFGFSTREYVLLHDKTSTAELDDDDGVSD
ncbi:uncharacterized protein LOC141899692 [Tubulanus polymorphus]|uniref:uncharacterized protein LOC141899692 n=1 Tax=Tubulanus polymorphus TaxID=672921 RepID=UPI003DA2BD79